MELKDILSISGKSGLYKNIGQSKNGVIVESLTDGKRFPAFAHERISSLAEISVFTTDEDVELKKVLKIIFEKYEGKEAIDAKSKPDALKTFMKETLPNYDENRVYVSDIKKLVSWYNLLTANNLLEFPEEEDPEQETHGEQENISEPVEEIVAENDENTTEDSAEDSAEAQKE